MKRVLFVLFQLALVLPFWTETSQALGRGMEAPRVGTPEAAVQAQAGQVDPARITVYVTRTGAKYHRDGCRYLSNSRIPMSLKDAAKQYEPCKVCRPPVMPIP